MVTESTTAKKSRVPRRHGVYIRMSEKLTRAVRELAASRQVPLQAIYEAAITAYLSPAAQDARDAMLARPINRLTRAVVSVDWNTKLLVAMMRYQIELDLSFLPEPSTDAERQEVADKGARRFDRFEQWLMRQLANPEGLYHRMRSEAPLEDQDFTPSNAT